MQVFCPLAEPYFTAEAMSLDRRRMNKQVIEAGQILNTINGYSNGWKNHPVILMYKNHADWLYNYMLCLSCYMKGDFIKAKYYSQQADKVRPDFLNNKELLDGHKRRLYTKNPELYPLFEGYGKSEINFYFVDGKLLKYKDGKRIKE